MIHFKPPGWIVLIAKAVAFIVRLFKRKNPPA